MTDIVGLHDMVSSNCPHIIEPVNELSLSIIICGGKCFIKLENDLDAVNSEYFYL